jgi:hypothetical protein
MFDINDEIEIHYPVSTHVQYFDTQIASRRRHFVVRRLRDLVTEPLTPEEFLRRPFVRRSRYLVTGTEIESNHWRRFYIGCAEEYMAPSQLRIGLYETNGSRPVALIGRAYEATVPDRNLLRRWLAENASKSFGGLLLRVYADDLSLRA